MATTDLIDTAAGIRMARIESQPFAENSYVVFREGDQECLVIDPGFEPEAIVSWIESRNLEPVAILVTHGHSDHIAGNAALRERWPSLPILIGRGDAPKLTDPTGNLSGPFGLPLVSPPADRLLDDGEAFELSGLRLVAHEIPGHSSGHVVFRLEGCQPPLVFGGDVLFQGSIGRTDFPDGDFAALERGIRRHLYTLPDETIVFPGHGEPTTIGHEKRHNPFVGDASSPD
jgi:hydroxyacylglutathione hydrolase